MGWLYTGSRCLFVTLQQNLKIFRLCYLANTFVICYGKRLQPRAPPPGKNDSLHAPMLPQEINNAFSQSRRAAEGFKGIVLVSSKHL